jgi:uncharacterized membrane protein
MSDAPVDPAPPQHAPLKRSRIWATFKKLIRARITAGLITILPIMITYWLVKLIFELMRDASQWVVIGVLEARWGGALLEQMIDDETQRRLLKVKALGGAGYKTLSDAFHAEGVALLAPAVQTGIAIFSVLLTIFILYSVGLFTANIVGRRFLYLAEAFVERVPLVKTVYGSTKQILSSLTGDQTEKFQRVALVPFPQEKMRCVAFITATFPDSISGEELCSVFIPTTPNPTTGYLQILKRKELVELDWSVEEAVQVIMSGGILRPRFLTLIRPSVPGAYLDTGPDSPPPPAPSAQ